MTKKRIFLIILFFLLIYNANALVPDLTLTYTSNENNVTLSWTYSFICNENWQCSDWSSCINNQQTRTCNDLNNCNTFVNKPAETQSCVFEKEEVKEQEKAEVAEEECTNDCFLSGLKECSGNAYHTCGNYDGDSCLEWNELTNCESNQQCSNGECLQQETQVTAEVIKNKITGNSIFDKILDFFKNLLGLRTRGAEIENVFNFKIYRDNILIDEGDNNKYCDLNNNCKYIDLNLNPGTYSYFVKVSSYLDETESKNSNTVNVNILSAIEPKEPKLPTKKIAEGCENECSLDGLKECSENAYKICGNYNLDTCLEWSNLTNCSSNKICFNGECIDTYIEIPVRFIEPINGSTVTASSIRFKVNTTIFNASVEVKNLANNINVNAIADSSGLFTGNISLNISKNTLRANAKNLSDSVYHFITVFRIQTPLPQNITNTSRPPPRRNNTNQTTPSTTPSTIPTFTQTPSDQEFKDKYEAQSIEDTDNDNLPDDWELAYFGNLAQNANDDPDNDGFTNIQEYKNNTNPKVSDLKKDNTLFGIIITLIILGIIAAPIVIVVKKIKKKKTLKLESQFTKPEHNQIYEYIEKARNRKISDIEIKNNLANAGWNSEDIDYVLNIKA